ncbi:hypothetical protein L1987_60265 [Smallanthus sonchifolius]|uniref:Uncharacterized protein n=2 Tax=Smallanthus sonchifolius TaxID=185202 RepID=A0ACB9D865_9ASTR|nr:hypothetical protein L1987_60262 [Smallanthus sonchifolius]KAI3742578.1 hypothetical protein L1987_60265 [Smallanthus sonchifolius]
MAGVTVRMAEQTCDDSSHQQLNIEVGSSSTPPPSSLPRSDLINASTKDHQHVEEFVNNLVDMMDKADLEMQNNNQNTALYLAIAAGNIKVVKIMVEKNLALLTIAGGNGNKVQYHLENH